MHIQEISDKVAERLKLEESSQPQPPQSGKTEESQQKQPSASAPSPKAAEEETSSQAESSQPPENAVPAMFPALSPGRAMTEKKTVDEVVAELKRTPFFMTELPGDEEGDEATEAFRALAYEGTPLENATDFKERGNECFRERRWADAKEFYTKGVLILAAEERKRKTASSSPPRSSSRDESADKKEEDDEEEVQKQRKALESLYLNRAACHLELRNYRSCWLDASASLRLNPSNVKAYYRSARAFLSVDRIAEADDACARGLALDPDNLSLRAVARDVIKRASELDAIRKKEEARIAQERKRAQLLKAALKARGIRTRETAQPPEMEDACLKLVPDPLDPASRLAFPTVLLYPIDLESDFIKAFEETQTLADHLAYVFPLPWDKEARYTLAGVECYIETATGGLVKVGKKVPLLNVLAGGKVEVVDEVVRVFVVPRKEAEAWVSEFKVKKAAEKGG
ncbi:TPR-like protein [Xylariaceae sp. FL0594]|nr:TPR-like protein [Xylariaceae sp. FL0594]